MTQVSTIVCKSDFAYRDVCNEIRVALASYSGDLCQPTVYMAIFRRRFLLSCSIYFVPRVLGWFGSRRGHGPNRLVSVIGPRGLREPDSPEVVASCRRRN